VLINTLSSIHHSSQQDERADHVVEESASGEVREDFFFKTTLE